jgi:transcription antitermination factor NusG
MSWFVFQTAPQREVQTARMLRQYGIETIVLMEHSLKRRHRKHKVATQPDRLPVPSMRGYIFLDMSPSATGSPWARLHACPVTVRPVGINGRPPRPLSDYGVSYITNPSRGTYHDTAVPRFQSAPDLKAGERVAVFHSGFDGVTGEVVSVTGNKAKILLPLFGSEFEVTVPVGSAVRAA